MRQCLDPGGDIRLDQLFYDLLGTVSDGFRYAGKPCHLDAVAFISASLYDLAQENDVVSLFLNGNAVVVYIADLASSSVSS